MLSCEGERGIPTASDGRGSDHVRAACDTTLGGFLGVPDDEWITSRSYGRYTFKMEHSQDGKNRMPFMDGTHKRTS
jgi:hypothetical protein